MSYVYFPFEARTLEEFSTWVNGELSRISDDLRRIDLVEYAEEPTQPYNGLRVIADGTIWNPGSGRGVYWYDASDASWNFMG
jgi:hypothetical protein